MGTLRYKSRKGRKLYKHVFKKISYRKNYICFTKLYAKRNFHWVSPKLFRQINVKFWIYYFNILLFTINWMVKFVSEYFRYLHGFAIFVENFWNLKIPIRKKFLFQITSFLLFGGGLVRASTATLSITESSPILIKRLLHNIHQVLLSAILTCCVPTLLYILKKRERLLLLNKISILR